jgi:cullin 1
LPEYLVKAERALEDEGNRVHRYLHSSSLSKLRGVAIMQILQEPQRQLLSEKPTCVASLLEADRLEDLARLYRMFALVENGLAPISVAFRQFVTAKGTALVEAREEQMKTLSRNEALSDPSFVQSLIHLHSKYKSVVASCFANDTSFQKSLKEGFEVFVNHDFEKLSIAALMSSFCDRVLKKSGERLTDDALEDAISRVVDLFSFLSDKDDFCEIYRNQLAKRLLTETSASEDAEKSLIQKLKMKCGANFTSKLEGMITDLSLANDMQREFREVAATHITSMEFSVTVLTTGFWPTYTPIETLVTPEMDAGLSLFRDFYSRRTQHRRLQWIHSLGTVTVASNLGGKRFDLVMNTYQALILMLFNDTDSLSVEDICLRLKLEESFVKKLLATFIFSKFKVLSKSGSSENKSIENSDVISVNDGFSVPHRKVKIPPPTAGTEETHNKGKVEEDRSFSIEAAIVRTMKTRKVLQHQQLVAEVVHQLTLFKPNPKVIKQRIENLIEREFLERDAENQNLYKYLA